MASEEELLLLQQNDYWMVLLSRMDYWSRFAFTKSVFSVSLTAQHRLLWLELCRQISAVIVALAILFIRRYHMGIIVV